MIGEEQEIPDEDFLEDEGEIVWFNDTFTEAVEPVVKQFLIDFYGERFYNLEADIYREVEKVIKETLMRSDSIPDILYKFRTITDEGLWQEALDKFELTDTSFLWSKKEQWYDRTYSIEEEDNFLDEIPEWELTDEQKQAKKIVESADNLLNYHVGFSNFMKQGSEIFINAAQTHMVSTCSFDLSVLSAEGFEELEKYLVRIADVMYDKIYGILGQDDE